MKDFTGCGVALVTPMKADGSIDYDALARSIEFMISSGVNFIVPVGTTGESPTLSHGEQRAVTSFTVRCVGGRVPVMAGTGSNNTREAVALTRDAFEVGADGVLVVSPYYNKPEPRGMRMYYEAVAEIGLPVFLYDIPGRTGRGVPPWLVCELAQEGVIQGLKWADGNLDNLVEIRKGTLGHNFKILSGDDALTLDAMQMGADGVISVVANIYPRETAKFVTACRDSLWKEAQRMHDNLVDVMDVLFIETNPIPIKTALEILYGNEYGEARFRSPMAPMMPETKKQLKDVLLAR